MSNTIFNISKKRFNALCYVRHPMLSFFSREVAWYQDLHKKLLGVLVLDYTDKDYGYVILGRDKLKVFRWIDSPKKFHPTIEEATEEMLSKMKEYETDGLDLYIQGDEKKYPQEIFTLKAKEHKIHPYFKLLTNNVAYEGAKILIQELAYTFTDVDGNYIKDFQTTGFNSRLWELYLYAYLKETEILMERNHQSPDFCLSYGTSSIFIEAVTVNANQKFDVINPKSELETLTLLQDYMPIKFGGPLKSKLDKKYWEKEHVKNSPFILAIHDYHIPASGEELGSMTWSKTALEDYLYGYRVKKTLSDGKITIAIKETRKGIEPILEEIISHNWDNKSIPSNFFKLPGAENISAVLFSNSATISKFNRMGKLAGLGSKDVKMIRMSLKYDPDPFAKLPIPDVEDIDDLNYEENWSDGIIMYHNPHANFPVKKEWFKNISHFYFDTEAKQFYAHMQPYDIINSFTQIISPCNR